jgi:hypothetical protein
MAGLSVIDHNDRRTKKSDKDTNQLTLFTPPTKEPPPAPYPEDVAKEPGRHTIDLFSGKTQAEEQGKAL